MPHKREVEKKLRAAFKKDRAKVDLSRMSRFGIIELSRQRLKPSLSDGVYTTCQYCQGRGRARSSYSLALTVLRKIQERVTQDDFNIIKGTLSKTVAEYLLNDKRDDLNAIERKYGLQIVIVGDENMPVEEFHFDFVKKDKPSAAIEDKEDRDKNKKDKPWYKRLLPV